MSRIGKIPVEVPKEVNVTIDGNSLSMKGPKGELALDVPLGVKVEKQETTLSITRANDVKQNRANHGTVRSILTNMVEGVTQGHKKELEIQGVGFRAQLKGDTLEANLGFSHPVVFKIPKGVTVTAPKPTTIIIEGTDKAHVGLVAAQIRRLKPPEPYKGKGIRYLNEQVRRKQGKSVAK